MQSLLSLARLMATFYLTCLVFIFLKYIREELMIVLRTSSSEAALPRMIARMESLGAGARTVGLAIPTG
ncbi:MAG: cation:dicarboxylase symporter family transporter, partial [Bryobacteraceae bacterium]|nr:cation:dicarboxylase symporter family transporter [Bryobacteraceae bacterium]